mgnify:CR=1 FL=1
MEHTDTKPILQGEYDISACALRSGFSGCGGSSTIPPGRWADFGGYNAGGFVNVDPTITGVDFKVLGNEFVPRAGQAYNYNPTSSKDLMIDSIQDFLVSMKCLIMQKCM